MALKLQVIICSTRPGRVGPAVARWFHGFARNHGQFDVELVDLADFALPLYDEPVHPRMQQYEHDHTKRWSASVAAADAYIFVTPEYNYSAPPTLVNALDFVYKEWNYKPCGFVSYGGVSGGLRA
ncbi:MAG TPA: NAD(P)H-dependent oxidoreductase, partial [Castellaniella sp.]|nr:NAD(P)H-dependent oxidoreductase [Castellaniella sp.]